MLEQCQSTWRRSVRVRSCPDFFWNCGNNNNNNFELRHPRCVCNNEVKYNGSQKYMHFLVLNDCKHQ
jgi:hypothetical protein